MREILESIFSNRYLLNLLLKRELSSRYRGSFLGVVWSFAQPLIMLMAYTFVFSVVFKMRWSSGSESSASEVGLNIFIGITLHAFLAECLVRGPALITSNATYVKKVIFPLELIPITYFVATIVQMGIGIVLWILASLVMIGHVSFTIILLPVLILPFLLFTLGVVFFVASLGVFVRDFTQAAGMISTFFLFLSPVFYPISALPKAIQPWMALNPLAFGIESARILQSGPLVAELISWFLVWFIHLLIALFVALGGIYWFQMSRRRFSDVV